MRPDRSISRFLRVLPLCLTAAALHAQVLVSLSTTANTLQSNQTAALTALVMGTSNTAVTWSFSPSVGTLGPGSGPDAGGVSTNTYQAPAVISKQQTVIITATSVADSTAAYSVQIQLTPAGVTITISPTSVALTDGETQIFTATVTNSSNTAVTWSISPQLGTINSAGSYTAPSPINASASVTVTATSMADTTKSGTATIALSHLIGVGSGAPTSTLIWQFESAFSRGGFSSMVSLPPLGTVKALGTTGYVQEFAAANGTSGGKLALAHGLLNHGIDILQGDDGGTDRGHRGIRGAGAAVVVARDQVGEHGKGHQHQQGAQQDAHRFFSAAKQIKHFRKNSCLLKGKLIL